MAKVADAMSAAYAERHHALPIQVTATEAVVATAEPYVTDWVAEFFALAKSVRTGQKAGSPSRWMPTTSAPATSTWSRGASRG